jgi:hypothetical protein
MIRSGSRFDLSTGRWITPKEASKIPGFPSLPFEADGLKTQIKLQKSLGPDERGVILPPASIFAPVPEGVRVVEGAGPGMVPSAALLFFDIVDSPINMLLSFDEVTDASLEKSGYLVHSSINANGSPNFQWMEGLTNHVLTERLSQDPGKWSVWDWPNKKAIPNHLLARDTAFRLSLESAILVPDVSATYEDTLEFKARYREELKTLRRQIDRLCLKVSQTGWDPLAVRIELEEFEESLAEYLSAARKSNLPKVLTSMDVSMNWSAAIVDLIKQAAPAAATALAGGALHVPLSSLALIVGTTTLSQLSISSTFGRKAKSENPFAYRIRVERQFN